MFLLPSSLGTTTSDPAAALGYEDIAFVSSVAAGAVYDSMNGFEFG